MELAFDTIVSSWSFALVTSLRSKMLLQKSEKEKVLFSNFELKNVGLIFLQTEFQ
jgi:hypothetical protein